VDKTSWGYWLDHKIWLGLAEPGAGAVWLWRSPLPASCPTLMALEASVTPFWWALKAGRDFPMPGRRRETDLGAGLWALEEFSSSWERTLLHGEQPWQRHAGNFSAGQYLLTCFRSWAKSWLLL